MATDYGDCHRYFLQTLMSRGILSGAEVKKLLEYSVKAFDIDMDVNDNQQLGLFVRTIDSRVKPLHMKVKSVIARGLRLIRREYKENTLCLLTTGFFCAFFSKLNPKKTRNIP